jgi:hypothetical protein
MNDSIRSPSRRAIRESFDIEKIMEFESFKPSNNIDKVT